jgi:hypothetical protein
VRQLARPEKAKNSKVARGSKPGERRGGRQLGTLNKKTVLRNAAMQAVAADPTLSPLDYFLALMRNEELPLRSRVTMATKALPYLHTKRRVDEPREPAPKQAVIFSNGAGADAKPLSQQRDATTDFDRAAAARRDTKPALMPLDFLLGVMPAPDTPPALRFRVACITTPYLHKKKSTGDPIGENSGKPDQYDFVVDRETAKGIRDDSRRLVRLRRTRSNNHERKKRKAEALIARIRSRVWSLIAPCPSLYGAREHEADKRRLYSLRKRRSRSPLSREADAEEARLMARVLTYRARPEAIARARIAKLEERERLARVAVLPPLTLHEQSCLRGLRTLFPKELVHLSNDVADDLFGWFASYPPNDPQPPDAQCRADVARHT